ncbi:hypothetical protein MJH12_08040 [bacterium]|nr:hypothetical protein [bacterium]
MKILMTWGGVSVPIDSMRKISNLSTGKTGLSIYQQLIDRGWEVQVLNTYSSAQPVMEKNCLHTVEYFEEFSLCLEQVLKSSHFDFVIHLAALADFSLDFMKIGELELKADEINQHKIDSDIAPILYLKKNPKLLNQIKSWSSNPKIKVIAFKFTDEEDSSKIPKMLKTGEVDFVVHNWRKGINAKNHLHKIYDRSQTVLYSGQTKRELGHHITTILNHQSK